MIAAAIVADPGTATGAAYRDWREPATRERLVLMDLFDLQTSAESPPYPRPWPDLNSKHHGHTDLSREEVEAILRAHGHDI